MATGRYEVTAKNTHSRWAGSKDKATNTKTGRHIILKPGTIVDLTDEEAEQLGESVKRIDGGARSSSNDAPLPGMPDQYVPPVATRKVGEGQPAQGKPSTYTSPANTVTDTNWDVVVSGGKAGELKTLVDAMEDPAEVQAVLKAEKAQEKPRSTVVEAAEKRLAELKGE